MKTLITLFLILSSPLTFAETDPFNVYQWNQKSTKPWFEWWYYKIVLPETKDAFFFVYGVVNPWDKKQTLSSSRSYVGMGDFTAKALAEQKYGVDQFKAAYDQTFIDIAGLTATEQNIKGDLTGPNGETYSWDVSVQKEWSFNANGWVTGTNISNIEWYPAQASARCSGTILSNQKLYQFTNAPCYQDRNWGHSFPDWWTWIVSNNFKNNPGTALAIGGGRPRVFNEKLEFNGVAVGLKHKGHEYHFRLNDLDRVTMNISWGKWEVTASNLTEKLEISASAPKEKFMDLQFMTPEGITFHDYECLTGDVTVKIYKKHSLRWELVDTLYSDNAGIEYGSPSGEKGAHDLNKLFTSKIHLQ